MSFNEPLIVSRDLNSSPLPPSLCEREGEERELSSAFDTSSEGTGNPQHKGFFRIPLQLNPISERIREPPRDQSANLRRADELSVFVVQEIRG